MEVARLFQVMPIDLKSIPVTEYGKMVRYYNNVRESQEDSSHGDSINVDRLLERGGRLKDDTDD